MNTVNQQRTLLKRDFFYHSLISGLFSKHDHFVNTNNGTKYYSNNISDQLIVLGSINNSIEQLRCSYRNLSKTTKIDVDYGDVRLQRAYLFHYLHPYICQSYSTFNLHNLQSILNIDSESVTISMFGCGACPELIAFTDFLSVYFPRVKHITANVFDIAVDTWSYSRNLVEEHIIPKSWKGSLKINTYSINLSQDQDFARYIDLSNSQVVTFQNCINEIVTESGINRGVFLNNIKSILRVMPQQSILLLSDLTGHGSVLDTLNIVIDDLNNLDNEVNEKIIIQQDYLTGDYPFINCGNGFIGLGGTCRNTLGSNNYLQMLLPFKSSVKFGSMAVIKGDYNTKLNISERDWELIKSLALSQPGEEEQILCSFGEVMSQNIIDKMSRVQTYISFNCFNGNEGKKWMSRLGDIITNAHQYLDNTKTIPNRIDYFY